MGSTGHLSELESLRSQVADLTHALAQRDRSMQDLLSPQEERVLALVAEGLTNKEIAAAMKLSDKTVKNYLANMFQKLHISRRAQAASFFVKRQT
jgi:two-component system, NarL family, response regulator DevR